MGSQFWFVARRSSIDQGQQQNAKCEDTQGSADYLQEMAPFYAVRYAARVPRLSILSREARFRHGVREAMHFYSESQMS